MMLKRWYKIVEKSSKETERYGPDHTMSNKHSVIGC